MQPLEQAEDSLVVIRFDADSVIRDSTVTIAGNQVFISYLGLSGASAGCLLEKT